MVDVRNTRFTAKCFVLEVVSFFFVADDLCGDALLRRLDGASALRVALSGCEGCGEYATALTSAAAARPTNSNKRRIFGLPDARWRLE